MKWKEAAIACCLKMLRKTTACPVSGVRFRYPPVADTEPFGIAAGPSPVTTVDIGSVPGHRRYYRGKQEMSRDHGFPQALPCLHFGEGRLE